MSLGAILAKAAPVVAGAVSARQTYRENQKLAAANAKARKEGERRAKELHEAELSSILPMGSVSNPVSQAGISPFVFLAILAGLAFFLLKGGKR